MKKHAYDVPDLMKTGANYRSQQWLQLALRPLKEKNFIFNMNQQYHSVFAYG